MKKSVLRKIYLEKRRALTPEEIALKTDALLRNFAGLDFSALDFLHIFYPIAEKGEFDTLKLAGYIRAIHPKIKLVLSKGDFKTSKLSHFIWDNDTILVVNGYGIAEPQSGQPVHADEIDMAVIPLLAFDEKGNRIGYGKGFYDRFLAGCRPDVQKIGVSFFPPVELISDLNEFDIPLNKCITPEKIWEF